MSAVQVRLDHASGQLLVGDEPVLLLGGQVHNSAGHPVYLAEVWDDLTDLGVDVVVVPFAWEDLEPTEGEFDFSGVDAVLAGAREHGLRLVLTWFGSWKNGESGYVPGWVKADPERFPVVRSGDGTALPVLSVFEPRNADADAAAFAAFLGHLAEVDAAESTVVLVQVENEVGLLGTERDHGEAAEQAWRAWSEGPDGSDDGERFMAVHYARYVEQVAASGRARHDLPLYTNCWLTGANDSGAGLSGGERPGDYPSGGPLPRLVPDWRREAPSLDLLAPDIYFGDPGEWSRAYREVNDALFVPELRPSVQGLAELFLAIGRYGAFGVSVFGVDRLRETDRPGWQSAFARLHAVAADVLAAQHDRAITGFAVGSPDLGLPESHTWSDGTVDVRVDADDSEAGPGIGLLMRLSDGDHLLVGDSVQVSATERTSGRPVGMRSAQELELPPSSSARPGRSADLRVRRRLNGDETANGRRLWVPRPGADGNPPFPPPVVTTGLIRLRWGTAWPG